MLLIFNLAKDLAALPRWGKAHRVKEENVLEHTGFVCLYSYYLARKYNADIGEVLTKAVLHDMEESITGEIPTPTKYASPDLYNQIRKFEEQSANKISWAVFGSEHEYEIWENAKNLDTLSGQIIYISDYAAVAYKVWLELGLGNASFKSFIPDILKRMTKAEMSLPESISQEMALLRFELEKLQ